jgi:hypothetical protein
MRVARFQDRPQLAFVALFDEDGRAVGRDPPNAARVIVNDDA